MFTRWSILAIALVILTLSACSTPAQTEPPSAAAAAFRPVASVEEIMESLVGHMAGDIFASVGTIIDENGEHEIVPENDEAWEEVRFAAMGLAETGNLLMFDSRVPEDGEAWMTYSQQLIDASLEAARAAAAKDPALLLENGGKLYEVCQACHVEYIPGLENDADLYSSEN